MPTPAELLKRLDERLVFGEIPLETYQELRSRLAASESAGSPATSPSADGPMSPAGMSVHDSVVKGNLTNVSVGSIHLQAPYAFAGGEMHYERCVLTILRAGGSLASAHADLDERRQEHGLSVRQAREVERACLETHRLIAPARGADERPAPPPYPARPLPPPPVSLHADRVRQPSVGAPAKRHGRKMSWILVGAAVVGLAIAAARTWRATSAQRHGNMPSSTPTPTAPAASPAPATQKYALWILGGEYPIPSSDERDGKQTADIPTFVSPDILRQNGLTDDLAVQKYRIQLEYPAGIWFREWFDGDKRVWADVRSFTSGAKNLWKMENHEINVQCTTHLPPGKKVVIKVWYALIDPREAK